MPFLLMSQPSGGLGHSHCVIQSLILRPRVVHFQEEAASCLYAQCDLGAKHRSQPCMVTTRRTTKDPIRRVGVPPLNKRSSSLGMQASWMSPFPATAEMVSTHGVDGGTGKAVY